MASSLFQLPPELRNELFKYPLYGASGFPYKIGVDGIGRLFRRTKEPSSSKRACTWLRKCALGRNTIGQRNRKKHHAENNQLMYICRRLYREIKGMELQRNLLVAEDGLDMTAVEQCMYLLRRCGMPHSVANKCPPQSFALQYGRVNFSAVITHCATHTDVLVKAHVPCWSHKKLSFVLLGLSCLFTLRADSRLVARIAQATSVSYLTDSNSTLLTTNIRIPSNLCFFSCEE
jgi:hypothetical protein